MKKLSFIAALLLPLTVLAAPITTMDVALEGVGESLPPALMHRMKAGLQTVGEHVFLGRDTEEVSRNLGAYETVTRDISSRVLYGYDIKSLTMHVGEKTTLSYKIAPYGEVIRSVVVHVDYGNLMPEGKLLVTEALGPIQKEIEELTLGMPLTSSHWMEGVIGDILRQRIKERLPEFTVQIAIREGKEAEVTLYVIPQGEIVQEVAVAFASKTLPKVLFLPMRSDYEHWLKGYRGLPSAFVTRMKPSIERRLQEALQESLAYRHLGITFTSHFLVGRTLLADIEADSQRYKVEVETRVDAGKETNNFSLHTHVGYVWGTRYEAYLNMDLYPGTVSWYVSPGFAYRMSKNTVVFYERDGKEEEAIVGLRQGIMNHAYARYQHGLKTGRNVYALGYRFSPYMSMEYIREINSQYIRILGHL